MQLSQIHVNIFLPLKVYDIVLIRTCNMLRKTPCFLNNKLLNG